LGAAATPFKVLPVANDEHVALLKKSVAAWNAWRDENPDIRPDLRGANLSRADLSTANLREADLRRADFREADLREADLRGANLSEANLRWAYLWRADLSNADLSGANLVKATLLQARLYDAKLGEADLSNTSVIEANFGGADLSGARLMYANLADTDFMGADLTGCRIYGVSAWGLKLETTKQQNLVITKEDEPTVTVDNIEVAQFVYLLLRNEKIRDLIDTIGKKGVLLLGRFTEGRIVVLERIREKLRDLGFVPMVFNFDKPETKDFSETVRLLASLSKFVIVDITNPRSTPLELQATVPDYMVPFAPILQQGEQPFAMFVDLQNKYDWVLQPVVGYPSVDRLIEVLEDKVVRPAEAKFNELLARRTQQLRVENV
jgi:Pentapeptide repeats (8 copies)